MKIEPDSFAPKKPYKGVKLFGQGELNRLIFAAMRKAQGRPMAVPEIARAIVEELGHGERLSPAWSAGPGQPPIPLPRPEADCEHGERFGRNGHCGRGTIKIGLCSIAAVILG
jgi:hypothetical protein